MPMCASAIVFLLLSSCNFALSKKDACPSASRSAEARSFPRPGQQTWHSFYYVLCFTYASTTLLSGIWATVGPDISNVLVELNLCDWKNSNVRCQLASQTKAEMGPLQHAGIARMGSSQAPP